MRRPVGFLTLATALALLTIGGASAGTLFSKTYEYKAATTLEIGADIEPGIRLDTVRFLIPAGEGGKISRAGDSATAEVAISNTGTESRKMGVALALFDEGGRLLGVASGGDKMMALKPGRQATYILTFAMVNVETPSATRFQVSVETKP